MHLEKCYLPEEKREEGQEAVGLKPISLRKEPAERIVTQEEIDEIFRPDLSVRKREEGNKRLRQEAGLRTGPRGGNPRREPSGMGENRIRTGRDSQAERYLLVGRI